MNADQCEFLAGEEFIQVVPRRNEPVLHLVCGDIGPLEAGVPIQLPVWLAIELRRKLHCQIIPPEWLCVEELKRLLVVETEMAGLASLPSCLFELAYMLVREAKEDLVDCDQIKFLIKDLWDKREAKLTTSTDKFLSQKMSAHARMDNVQQLELAGARTVLSVCKRVAMLVRNVQLTQPE